VKLLTLARLLQLLLLLCLDVEGLTSCCLSSSKWMLQLELLLL
jgi:hypothetical protein